MMTTTAYSLWKPKPDITLYELALLLRLVHLNLEQAEEFHPVSAMRHFEWVYHSEDTAVAQRVVALEARIKEACAQSTSHLEPV